MLDRLRLDLNQTPAPGDLEGRRRVRLLAEPPELGLDPVPGYRAQVDGLERPFHCGIRMEPEPGRVPGAPQRAGRIVGQGSLVKQAESSLGQSPDPAERVEELGRTVEGYRDRVDREVATGQIELDRCRRYFGQGTRLRVVLGTRPRDVHRVTTDRHGGRHEPLVMDGIAVESAGKLGRVGFDDEIEILRDPPKQQIANRSPDQPGRRAGERRSEDLEPGVPGDELRQGVPVGVSLARFGIHA